MPPRRSACREAGYVLLRLPLEVRDLFREWLMANFPDRYRHVFKLIRDTRGGKDYDSTWGKRMTGGGPVAWMIGRRFELACEKLGLNKSAHAGSPPTTSSRRAAGASNSLKLVLNCRLGNPRPPQRGQNRVGPRLTWPLARRALSLSSDVVLWTAARTIAASARAADGPRRPPAAWARRTSVPTFRRERAAIKRGIWPVAGCDEAGRGPLAGPVVAAAVILDPKRVPRGLDDSKKLDPRNARKALCQDLREREVAVAFAPPARIDRDNILRASLWALARAVAALPVRRSWYSWTGATASKPAATARP